MIPSSDLTQARALLQRVFGYEDFRGQQAAAIGQLLNGDNALVLMPTGGGKSLCYQVPALLLPGVAVVVSPLIALMQDQVEALQQLGVRAAFLNSTLSHDEALQIEQDLQNGSLDLLYLAPERLLLPQTLALLSRLSVSLFAIDEAHCISQWGHDFRPEYAQLSLLAEQFPAVPRVALTATADDTTRQDIVSRLQLRPDQIFLSSFDRPNIRYHIEQGQQGRQQLLRFMRQNHHGDAGIVYCLSRKKVESTAAWLCSEGVTALAYHAGLSADERAHNQQRFLREEGIVMVATVAFGMGIDKPNVRFVAHLDLPKSVEAYYQETGRAGRDGLAASAWMHYGLQGVIHLRQMLDQSQAEEQQKRIEQHKLEAMLGLGESTVCRRQRLLAYFGEALPEPCGNCDNCLTPPKTWDGTEAAQKALSAVYRTGQRFGVNHVVSVLRGDDNPKIQQFNHQQLSVYGIGRERDTQAWRSVFRQLVAHGLLRVDMQGYGALQLHESARPILRGEQRLDLRVDPTPEKKKSKTGKGNAAAEQMNDVDRELWEALRQHRLSLAKAQEVPPYVIFHDATLMEMVRLRPLDWPQLRRVDGVGQKKLERYGDSFLEVILAFEAGQATSSQVPTEDKGSDVDLLAALQRGERVADVLADAKVDAHDVYQQLCQLMAQDQVDFEWAMGWPEEKMQRLFDAASMSADESGRLSREPLSEAFGEPLPQGLVNCLLMYFTGEV